MGMDVHVKSYDNRTALQLAKDKHKHKCVSFLKAWLELLTTFIRAAEEGNIVDLERIIAEVNKAYPLRHLRDKDGRSALNWAAASGHLDSMKILADHFDTLTDVDKVFSCKITFVEIQKVKFFFMIVWTKCPTLGSLRWS